MQIVAINREQKLAVFDTGDVASFSNMFTSDNEETNDGHEAFSAVVPRPDGKWEAIRLDDYEPVSTH